MLPADLGQGVNSALLDVGTLSNSLAVHPGDVSAALHDYEQKRLPENSALIRLMQVRSVPSHTFSSLCHQDLALHYIVVQPVLHTWLRCHGP